MRKRDSQSQNKSKNNIHERKINHKDEAKYLKTENLKSTHRQGRKREKTRERWIRGQACNQGHFPATEEVADSCTGRRPARRRRDWRGLLSSPFVPQP